MERVREQNGEWVVVSVPTRVDSFNFEDTKKEFDELAAKTKKIALDVSSAQFVSIPMIKYIHALATDVAQKGGQLALVGPTEKLKRQIHIFASLEPFRVFKVNEDFI